MITTVSESIRTKVEVYDPTLIAESSNVSSESCEPSEIKRANCSGGSTSTMIAAISPDGQNEGCQNENPTDSHAQSNIDIPAIQECCLCHIENNETFENHDHFAKVRMDTTSDLNCTSPANESGSCLQTHHTESIKEQKRPEIGKSPAHNTCPICFEPLTADPSLLCSTTRRSASAVIAALREPGSTLSFSSAMTPCGHVFHASCIIEAMEHSFTSLQPPRCPLCREALERSRWDATTCGSGPGWQVLVKAARGARRRTEPDHHRIFVRQVMFVLGCSLLVSCFFIAFYNGK